MDEKRVKLVTPEQAFWFKEGGTLRTLGELAVALGFMPAEVFGTYVAEDKNDFAQWVESCLGELELAESMRAQPEMDAMRQAVWGALNS